MVSPNNIAAVILAAGSSRRLGKPKQLLPFGGTTLLEYQIGQLEGFAFGEKLLILGAHHEEIEKEVDTSEITVLHNQLHEHGLSSSIHCSIQYLIKKRQDIQGILFLVCDQPEMSKALVDQILQTHQPGKITTSRYANTYGVPMLIDLAFWAELLALEGDKGAKAVVRQHQDELLFVDFPKGDFDVDTMEDAERMSRLYDV